MTFWRHILILSADHCHKLAAHVDCMFANNFAIQLPHSKSLKLNQLIMYAITVAIDAADDDDDDLTAIVDILRQSIIFFATSLKEQNTCRRQQRIRKKKIKIKTDFNWPAFRHFRCCVWAKLFEKFPSECVWRIQAAAAAPWFAQFEAVSG